VSLCPLWLLLKRFFIKEPILNFSFTIGIALFLPVPWFFFHMDDLDGNVVCTAVVIGQLINSSTASWYCMTGDILLWFVVDHIVETIGTHHKNIALHDVQLLF